MSEGIFNNLFIWGIRTQNPLSSKEVGSLELKAHRKLMSIAGPNCQREDKIVIKQDPKTGMSDIYFFSIAVNLKSILFHLEGCN